MAVGAADLHRDGELLHNVHEFGFGDCGRQDGEVSEVVGYVGSFSLGQSEELAKNLPAPELREEDLPNVGLGSYFRWEQIP